LLGYLLTTCLLDRSKQQPPSQQSQQAQQPFAAITLPTSLKATTVYEAQRQAKEQMKLWLGGSNDNDSDDGDANESKSKSPRSAVAKQSRPPPFKITKRQAEYLRDAMSAK
jgi:hypothetical protein